MLKQDVWIDLRQRQQRFAQYMGPNKERFAQYMGPNKERSALYIIALEDISVILNSKEQLINSFSKLSNGSFRKSS